ncbi:MAG: PEP-CTERM sorting domain-containing protein, partial [Planctomycetes bacterium]|nr:PEP-CTERM sorting domain-containing protein [Planctomycetota bacterium]
VKLSDPKGDDIAPDKIIRKTGGVFPDPPAPVDIPIEIVSLNLISAEPIIVNYSGGATELWDAQVELDPSAASQGLLQITHNPAGEPDGGVMNDGYIDILGTIKFTHTPAGGEPRHRFFSIVDRTQLTTTDAKWAHQHSSIAGGANREFIPGADPANPSAPLQILLFQGGGLDLPLRVMDVVPEPSSMMLVSLGSLALIAVGFRRRF